MSAIIVFCCCPDSAVASTIARHLVEERLAACVNQLPGVVSTYRWNDAIAVDNEVQLMIKTTRERFEAVRDRVLKLHPYELPEIIAVDVGAAHMPYLDWVAQQV